MTDTDPACQASWDSGRGSGGHSPPASWCHQHPVDAEPAAAGEAHRAEPVTPACKKLTKNYIKAYIKALY